jgi:PAS domain S-box-containing protein
VKKLSKTGQSEVDIKIIGLLLASETSLHVFPSDSKMIDSAIQALKRVPGVSSCSICVKGISKSVGSLVTDKCDECELPSSETVKKNAYSCRYSKKMGFDVFSLKTTMNFFGFLIIEIKNPEEYQPYPPLISNFSNAISVVMENRQHKSQLFIQNEELKKHRDNLEKLVKERTAALAKSERLLSRTQEISQVGGWEYDIEDDAMYWTDEMYRIHGFDINTTQDGSDSHIEKSLECYRPEDRLLIMEAFEKCIHNGQEYDHEYPITKTNEEKIWVRTTGKPVFSEGKIVKVIGSFMDITIQKKAYKKIQASLNEKETLLHEIHHRVKNNMQVISSLLKLQSNSIEDTQVKEVLKESQGRVYAMSAVHETLHGLENLSEIDLKNYLSRITTSIFQTYSYNHTRVSLKIDLENLPISINQAYPLGLVINELISNSLKYAFPDDRKGEITVRMKKRKNELELTFIDNGIGMPEDFNWKNSNTLGLKLVRTLVENQLDGSIDMESKNGTKFTIKFNIET